MQDVLCEATRYMPRSNVQRICDGVASLLHVPKNKLPEVQKPSKVERINPMRYAARVDREGYAQTIASMRREVQSKDVVRLLDEVGVPRNIYDDLIDDVLERCAL